VDTVRGANKNLRTNLDSAEDTTNSISSFTSTGFDLAASDGPQGGTNYNAGKYVAWTFKESSKFFDIVTYTGNGTSGRTVSHSLGEAPGMIIVKRTDATRAWYVFHRSVGSTKYLSLNETDVAITSSSYWNDTDPTSTEFTLGSQAGVNASGGTYVAYLFAHNNSSINCGTYTNTSSGVTVDLGFQPQWMMFKRTDATSNWSIVDVTRGITEVTTVGDNSNQLRANLSNAENTEYSPHVTSTGFKTVGTGGGGGGGSGTYIYVAIGEVTNTDTLDLSTGSVFNYTPTASKKLKLSNPTAATGATLLFNGSDAAGVTGNFSTTLYTGNGSTQDVTTNIDLSGSNEGLVWMKGRTGTTWSHALYDTVRGATYGLEGSNNTNAQAQETAGLTAFSSTGFSLGNRNVSNENGSNFVAWTWKSAPNFFDIVTYTGNGTARAISHNLGSVPGMVVYKNLSSNYGWQVYHRGMANDRRLEWDDPGSGSSSVGWWDQTTPVTSSVLNIGTNAHVNNNGHNYVAYLFGHDTSSGPIQCGSYTGNGSSTGPIVTLGWQPQWLMVKSASDTNQDWYIIDTVRGFVSGGNDALLRANTNGIEATSVARVSPSSTGFQIATTDAAFNQNNASYIYVAIRAVDVASTTYDRSIKFSGGTAPDSPAVGETDVVTINTTDGGTNYYASLAIDGAK